MIDIGPKILIREKKNFLEAKFSGEDIVVLSARKGNKKINPKTLINFKTELFNYKKSNELVSKINTEESIDYVYILPIDSTNFYLSPTKKKNLVALTFYKKRRSK